MLARRAKHRARSHPHHHHAASKQVRASATGARQAQSARPSTAATALLEVIAPSTVRTYIKNLYSKLGVTAATQPSSAGGRWVCWRAVDYGALRWSAGSSTIAVSGYS